MIIDSLAGVLPPQTLDAKAEKKRDAGAPKPVAESNKSYDSQLDMERQNISKNNSLKHWKRGEGYKAVSYNSKGSPKDFLGPESEEGKKHKEFDIII